MKKKNKNTSSYGVEGLEKVMKVATVICVLNVNVNFRDLQLLLLHCTCLMAFFPGQPG